MSDLFNDLGRSISSRIVNENNAWAKLTSVLLDTPCNADGSLTFNVVCTIAAVTATPQTVPIDRIK